MSTRADDEEDGATAERRQASTDMPRTYSSISWSRSGVVDEQEESDAAKDAKRRRMLAVHEQQWIAPDVRMFFLFKQRE